MKTYKTTNFFPVELIHEDDKVTIIDCEGIKWEVQNKDNSLLNEAQYDTICAEDLGFWDVASLYKLIEEKEV